MSASGQRIAAPCGIPEHCCTETLHRVCVGETDMMGVVHHANYVAFFEKGRLEYLRRRGTPYKAMIERGYHMPVIELSMRYRKPAHFDDVLSVETRLSTLSRVTARFDYTVRRPHVGAPLEMAEPAPLLVEGHVVLACVDTKGRPRALPADIVRMLYLPEASRSDDLLTPGSRAGRADNA